MRGWNDPVDKKTTLGSLLEDEDIERIAQAVTDRFLLCPSELDKVLRSEGYRISLDAGPMMDFTKEHPMANYRVDLESTATLVLITFSRYGHEVIGRFAFRRNHEDQTTDLPS